MNTNLDFGETRPSSSAPLHNTRADQRAADSLNELLIACHSAQQPPFTGSKTGTTLEDFLQSLDRLRIVCPSLTEQDIVRTAISRCSDSAFQVVQHLDPVTTTLPRLRKELELHFAEHLGPVRVQRDFINCFQKEGQSVQDFYLELHRLSNLKDKHTPLRPLETAEVRREIIRAELAEKFVDGLLPLLAFAVRNNNCSSAEEMLRVAKREEEALHPFLTSSLLLSPSPAQAATNFEAASSAAPAEPSFGAIQRRGRNSPLLDTEGMVALDTGNRQLRTRLDSFLAHHAASIPTSPVHTRNAPQTHQPLPAGHKRPKSCGHCQAPGHIAKFCPQRHCQ